MVECADGLAQVAVVVGRAQVDLHVLVVGDHPRKDGVLVLKLDERISNAGLEFYITFFTLKTVHCLNFVAVN